MICASARKEPGCISGHGLAVANLYDIVPFARKHLKGACMEEMPDRPSFAWLLSDLRPVYPIPVKGKLHLFNVDEPIEFIPDTITDDELSAIYCPLFA